MAVGGLDDAGYLVRSRRLMRLSQREMARAMGVGQSTWAGYESGARPVPHRVLVETLETAGLRISVVDVDGREVDPFPQGAVRDNAGRRFPAHLEVQPPDRLSREALRAPRYDRLPAKAWYHRRGDGEGVAGAAVDHPTDLELAVRRRALWTAGAARLEALRLRQDQGADRAQGGVVGGD